MADRVSQVGAIDRIEVELLETGRMQRSTLLASD
jgi:hypothetical protein